MEREVKVRIDLVLDNQASLLDSVKQINQQVDKYEEKLKRLKNLQATGNYNYLLEKEVDLLRKKNQYQRELQTANTPLANAQRQLDFENRIFQIQRQRDNDAINRQAHYQAKFGRLGGVMSVVDRMTMGPLGYASMSGAMLGAVGSAGGATLNMFTGTLKRAAGEIGIMFIPAILNISSHLHSFAGWVRGLNPTLKTTIGYLATYGLVLSAGAKLFTMVVSGLAAFNAALAASTARLAAKSTLDLVGGGTSAAGSALGLAGGGAAAGAGLGARAGMTVAGAAKFGLTGLKAAAMTAEAYRIYNSHNKFLATAESATLGTGMGNIYFGIRNLLGLGGNDGVGRLGGAVSSSKPSPPPLSIPGFQSQQMDIFSLKDAVQRESLRDPNEQENFNLSVTEFRTLLNKWTEWFSENPRGRMGDIRLG